MSNFIYCFVYFVIICIIEDIIHKNRYKYCKKKCSGKKCRNWQCKLYNECSLMYVQQHSKQILNAAGYELVIGEDKKAPLPDYIPGDGFPVEFVRTESRLYFNTEEEMLAWASMIYKHYIEFINNDER